ncbi:MAG: antitoxin VapB family protein [Candidatus Micrarchaeota archaeon]
MARAIMVSDNVYKELSMLKKAGESFTMVINRFLHTNERKDLADFAGAWKFLSKDALDNIECEAKKARKNWRPAQKW